MLRFGSFTQHIAARARLIYSLHLHLRGIDAVSAFIVRIQPVNSRKLIDDVGAMVELTLVSQNLVLFLALYEAHHRPNSCIHIISFAESNHQPQLIQLEIFLNQVILARLVCFQ